jgi:hypothetical protein
VLRRWHELSPVLKREHTGSSSASGYSLSPSSTTTSSTTTSSTSSGSTATDRRKDGLLQAPATNLS